MIDRKRLCIGNFIKTLQENRYPFRVVDELQ